MPSRKIFSLFGTIAIEGMAATNKELKAFNKDVYKTTKALNKMGRDVGKMGKSITMGLTAPLIGATTALITSSNKVGDYADNLLDLEQITGLTTDNLQGLEQVARVAGVSFDGLSGTIGKFTSRLPQILSEGGAASDAINALGVNIFDTDGSMRDMNQLFPELVNSLQGVESVTDRNVIAQQIFGKSLNDLAPVLSMTQDEFNETFGAGEKLSSFMSTESIEAANNYRIEMENVKAQFTGLWRDLTVNLIPILKDVLFPLLKDNVFPVLSVIAGKVGDLAKWFKNLNPAVKDLAGAFIATLAVMGPILIVVGKFMPMLKGIVLLYKAWTAGQIALNVAMTANPIGLIVAGVAALIAITYTLIKNWDKVKVSFVNTWDFIKFHFMNIVDQIDLLGSKMVLGLLNQINKFGKYIPGLNKGLDSLVGSSERYIKKVESQIKTRKADYQQAKLSKEMTDEETEAIKKAKSAVTDYSMELFKNTDTKKENTEKTKESVSEDEKAYTKKAELEDEWNEKLFESVATKEEILYMERRKAVENAEKLGADTTAIKEYYNLEELKMEEKKQRERIKLEKQAAEEIKKKRADIKNTSISLVGQINKVWADSIDMRKNKIDEESEKQKSAIEQSMMNEEEKAEAIEKIDEEADAKKLELQKENAKREKAMAIFSAIINTASAVVKALTLGPPAGLIFALLFGALGIAQIAMIAAQPMPFAEGGLVKSNPGTGIVAQIGEGKQDELVMPMETGASMLADNIMRKVNQLGGAMLPKRQGGKEVHNHFHIGTLIADEFGLKNLERKLRGFRVSENQRTGYVTA